jgi:hypothetical protein
MRASSRAPSSVKNKRSDAEHRSRWLPMSGPDDIYILETNVQLQTAGSDRDGATDWQKIHYFRDSTGKEWRGGEVHRFDQAIYFNQVLGTWYLVLAPRRIAARWPFAAKRICLLYFVGQHTMSPRFWTRMPTRWILGRLGP